MARTRVPRKPPRQSWVRTYVALTVVGALAVGAGVFYLSRQPRSRSNPAAGLHPAAAFDSATRLVARERFRESLPFYRRALADPGADGRVHAAYAAALSNVTLQFTTRSGVLVPETRSSVERVAMMSEAFQEFERAARMAPDGKTRAWILATWANQLYLYGFVWEAFVAYRQASQDDPSNPSYARSGDGLMRIMQDPTRSKAIPEAGEDRAGQRAASRGEGSGP